MVGCVPVFDDGDEVEVCHGQIHLHVLFYLSVGELRVAVEVLEGLVHHIEYLLAVSVLAIDFVALQLLHLQVVALLNPSGSMSVNPSGPTISFIPFCLP